MDQQKIPPRTIERLSKYRRLLSKYSQKDEQYIFSHDLARLLNLTSVQVRRDLMLLGISGNHRKGYNVKDLIEHISEMIDTKSGHNLAIIGMGNLGRAVTTFIRKNETKMNIVAGFDIDATKTGKEVAGVTCYHIESMPEKMKELGVDIAVLTTPPDSAVELANIIVDVGITGILNFTSEHLDVPENVYLKNYDIITSLEEIGFFIK